MNEEIKYYECPPKMDNAFAGILIKNSKL